MNEKCKGIVGTVSKSQEERYDTFSWNIKNFSLLSEHANVYYLSPTFDFKGFKSYLYFFPNGILPHSKGYFSVYFISPDYNLTKSIYVKLGVKTRNGRIEKWFSRNVYPNKENGLGLEDVISRSAFLERKSELAPSDCLTFVIFMSSNAPKLISDSVSVSVQTEPESAEEDESKETSPKKGSKKVVEDIGNLLASGVKSDVVIHVEDTQFKVHGCILAARTPVFSALFEHETIEKSTNEITIKDCEASIFDEFLIYIYTGHVQNLTTEAAFALYPVADKYLVEDLKELCKKHIQDNLCIESFCGAIELALRYGEQDLLQFAIDYFVLHFDLISNSLEWQSYIKENSKEANEILTKAFSKLSQCLNLNKCEIQGLGISTENSWLPWFLKLKIWDDFLSNLPM